MTTVYFVQHGIAEPKEVDQSRPLSNKGVEVTKRIAGHLASQGILINKIFHSGKLRAEQTATVFFESMDVKSVSKLEGMNPNDDTAILINQLTDSSMYVGHLPHVQKVVSKIVSGDENSQVLVFQNSAVACIEIKGNQGHLKWFLTPELCT